MPSVTDIQQQTSKMSLSNDGKSTPPPPSGVTTDSPNADPITQVIFALEKKQRNLGKRKDKLESYQQEAKSGKELNKDQKEALAKYGDVISQIDCVKDLYEQIKKIQVDVNKNQKRLTKQAAEEKRSLISQRLREYAQLRYLLDHRPSTLKAEESSLLDELARVIVPSDVLLPTITRSVDIVLAIYQGGPLSSTVKTLTNRSSQEVRDILEQLMNQPQLPKEDKSTLPPPPPPTQFVETVKQTPLVPQPPPPISAPVLPQREPTKQQQSNNTNDALGSTLTQTHLVLTNPNEHPLQFDTRDQNISYHQLMQDSPFFLPLETTNTNQQTKQDSSTNQDNTQSQSNESNHYIQSFNAQTSSQEYPQTSTQQQGMNNYDQDNSSNVAHSNNMQGDEQQSEEQWQHRRGNNGNNYRGGQYNGNGNKNYNRGGANNYNQQQWRGPRGGHHDASYGSGQRQYNENNNAGRGGSRGGPNPNYRGNRGGNYRGGNRGNGNAGYNDNGYQRSSQYQQNNEQQSRPVASNQQQ